MNRRGFLGGLLAVTVSAAFDPERALWVPGKKKIFIPPAPRIYKFNGREWHIDLTPGVADYRIPRGRISQVLAPQGGFFDPRVRVVLPELRIEPLCHHRAAGYGCTPGFVGFGIRARDHFTNTLTLWPVPQRGDRITVRFSDSFSDSRSLLDQQYRNGLNLRLK